MTLCKSGALALSRGQDAHFSLYTLRGSPLPSKEAANPSNEVIREHQVWFTDALSLSDELRDGSIELYSMHFMATQLLHYLSSSGVRAKDMLEALRKCRVGKWEQLRKESVKKADKIKAKKSAKPDQARMRTERRIHAEMCRRRQSLRAKANKIIRQELLQACADDTIDKLRLLHPHGDLNFKRDYWPLRAKKRAFWAREQGMEIIEQHFSVGKMSKYFQHRPALGAADIIGWRGREHIAKILTNKDSEFHHLFRKHIILPFLHDHVEPAHATQNAGGHLSASLKLEGGIRPLLRGSVFRRCFTSLAAASITDEWAAYFTTSFPNFMQCAGGLKDGTCVCAKSLQLFDSVKHPADKT